MSSTIFTATKKLLPPYSALATAAVFLLTAVSFDAHGDSSDVICPAAPSLSAPNANTVVVSNVDELYKAFSKLSNGATVAIKPGTYKLRATLGITADNVTVRGMSTNCNEVTLVGAGMDNPEIENGFWISARNAKIALIKLQLHRIYTTLAL